MVALKNICVHQNRLEILNDSQTPLRPKRTQAIALVQDRRGKREKGEKPHREEKKDKKDKREKKNKKDKKDKKDKKEKKDKRKQKAQELEAAFGGGCPVRGLSAFLWVGMLPNCSISIRIDALFLSLFFQPALGPPRIPAELLLQCPKMSQAWDQSVLEREL